MVTYEEALHIHGGQRGGGAVACLRSLLLLFYGDRCGGPVLKGNCKFEWPPNARVKI